MPQPPTKTLVPAIALGIFLSLSSCSYAVRMQVPSSSAGIEVSPSDSDRVLEIAAQVARQYGLEEVRHQQYLESLSRQAQEPLYASRELARFVRGRDEQTEGSRVLLVVSLEKASKGVTLLVRDWDSLGPTQFTTSLIDALVGSLRAAFPSSRIDVERLQDMPIWYYP